MKNDYQDRANQSNAMWDTFKTALDVQCDDARLAMRQAEMVMETSGLDDRARATEAYRQAQEAYDALARKAVLQ